MFILITYAIHRFEQINCVINEEKPAKPLIYILTNVGPDFLVGNNCILFNIIQNINIKLNEKQKHTTLPEIFQNPIENS